MGIFSSLDVPFFTREVLILSLSMAAVPIDRLEGLDSNAYEAFQASRNLKDVVDRVLAHRSGEGGQLQVRAQLMTPVLPMLAEACKSVGYAMKKVCSITNTVMRAPIL